MKVHFAGENCDLNVSRWPVSLRASLRYFCKVVNCYLNVGGGPRKLTPRVFANLTATSGRPGAIFVNGWATPSKRTSR